MGTVLEVWGILFLAVVCPIWIISHYITKARSNRGLTPEDESKLTTTWKSTRTMEERIRTLECILDADSPGWRKTQ